MTRSPPMATGKAEWHSRRHDWRVCIYWYSKSSEFLYPPIIAFVLFVYVPATVQRVIRRTFSNGYGPARLSFVDPTSILRMIASHDCVLFITTPCYL